MITNLTIGRYGRFANAMFQIAAVIGIARKWGEDFAFLPWMNYDHKERFGSTEDIDLQKYFVNPLPSFDKEYGFEELAIPWGYYDIQRPLYPHQNITGHFQSEKWFKHCIDEVRHYFRMKDEIIITDNNLSYHFDKVAIHIRRGDYDNHYHTILDVYYYKNAMYQFPKGTHFIVFSDDKEAAKDLIKRTYETWNVWYSGETDYISDFCFMKQCGGFICANSSYSLMAAILSEAPNKKIICPSKWFGPAWNPDTKDLYPEGAIII